jgi:hypothetical protein
MPDFFHFFFSTRIFLTGKLRIIILKNHVIINFNILGPKTGEEFEVTIDKGKTLHVKTLAVAEDLTPNAVFVTDAAACKVSFGELKVFIWEKYSTFKIIPGNSRSPKSRQTRQRISCSANAWDSYRRSREGRRSCRKGYGLHLT